MSLLVWIRDHADASYPADAEALRQAELLATAAAYDGTDRNVILATFARSAFKSAAPFTAHQADASEMLARCVATARAADDATVPRVCPMFGCGLPPGHAPPCGSRSEG